MDTLERQRKHYEQFIKDNPEGNYKTTGWSSEEVQRLCYKSIIDMAENYLMLNVGCGYGAFLSLDGIDILPEMIQFISKKNINNGYEVADIMTYEPKRDYDYLIAVGTFNLNDDEYLYKAIDKMLSIAKKGVILCLLNEFTKETKQKGLVYRNPYKMLIKYPKVKFDNTYLDHCFTIGVFK